MTKLTSQEQPKIYDEESIFDLVDELGIVWGQAQKEEAEIIRIAVNSHEALLDACKEALSWLEKVPAFVDRSVHAEMPISKIKSALKLAEGK